MPTRFFFLQFLSLNCAIYCHDRCVHTNRYFLLIALPSCIIRKINNLVDNQFIFTRTVFYMNEYFLGALPMEKNPGCAYRTQTIARERD